MSQTITDIGVAGFMLFVIGAGVAIVWSLYLAIQEIGILPTSVGIAILGLAMLGGALYADSRT